VTLTLCGEIDIATAPALERELPDAESSRPRRVVLDLGAGIGGRIRFGQSGVVGSTAGCNLALNLLLCWSRCASANRTIELARAGGASVHVFSIARVHGTSFGFPNPGLLPTKREWQEQRELVRKAVARLRRKGIEAEGHVLGTRKATKRICDEARKEGCDAIVMTADPDRNRLVADMMWTQEPQRVRRRAKVPVFLVADE
jgi:nucleotide-binding universal stress UspA family protein